MAFDGYVAGAVLSPAQKGVLDSFAAKKRERKPKVAEAALLVRPTFVPRVNAAGTKRSATAAGLSESNGIPEAKRLSSEGGPMAPPQGLAPAPPAPAPAPRSAASSMLASLLNEYGSDSDAE